MLLKVASKKVDAKVQLSERELETVAKAVTVLSSAISLVLRCSLSDLFAS